MATEQIELNGRMPDEIEVPARTAWPLVLAFGFTLMFAGLLTSTSVNVLGVLLAEQDAPAYAEDHRPVPADQGGERPLLAALRKPAQQVGVGEFVEFGGEQSAVPLPHGRGHCIRRGHVDTRVPVRYLVLPRRGGIPSIISDTTKRGHQCPKSTLAPMSSPMGRFPDRTRCSASLRPPGNPPAPA